MALLGVKRNSNWVSSCPSKSMWNCLTIFKTRHSLILGTLTTFHWLSLIIYEYIYLFKLLLSPLLKRSGVPVRRTACRGTFFCRIRTARPKTATFSSTRLATFPVCTKTRQRSCHRPNTPTTCAVIRRSIWNENKTKHNN